MLRLRRLRLALAFVTAGALAAPPSHAAAPGASPPPGSPAAATSPAGPAGAPAPAPSRPDAADETQADADDVAPPGDGEDGGADADELELDPNRAARRGIRGTPLPSGSPEDPELLAQRAFEETAFPRRRIRPNRPAPVRPESVVRPEVRPLPAWARGIKLGDIPVRWDARVIRYLEFYKDDPRGRALMTTWLRNQGRYGKLILDAARRHRLPEDLLYLCMIESSYQPAVHSRVGASGLWQFMPAGGRVYGLRIDHWVDERMDPVKSTEAAMLFLGDLHERFGNWHLAMAAYNAGHGAVLSSIAKFNTNDFWTLLELESGLPWESSIYVPKMLAASLVGRNRALFGYQHVVAAPPYEYDTVTVPPGTSLAQVGKAIGVDASVIQDLNPHLLRGRTPPKEAAYPVRIPRGTRQEFLRGRERLRSEWDGDRLEAHVLRHGERFEDVARTHGIGSSTLRRLNGITDMSAVRPGLALVVPRLDPVAKERNRRAAEDDLYASGLVQGNPGDRMIVALPEKDFRIPGRERIFYRVVAGDTLGRIAAAIGANPGEVARWNGLDTEADLQARMVLALFVAPGFDATRHGVAVLDERRLDVVTAGSPEHIAAVERRRGRKRLIVKARKGDTYESIGRRYGLSKYSVSRINRKSSATDLSPGDEVIVYAVVDRAQAQRAGVLSKGRTGRPSKKGPPPRRATAAKASKGKAPARGKAVATKGKPAPAKGRAAPVTKAKAVPTKGKVATRPAKAKATPAKAKASPPAKAKATRAKASSAKSGSTPKVIKTSGRK